MFIVEGWFDPSSTPRGRVYRSILVVQASSHCDLDQLDEKGCWKAERQFMIGDHLVKKRYKEKSSVLLNFSPALFIFSNSKTKSARKASMTIKYNLAN